MSSFDISALRAQFPILGAVVHGNPLVYLDNAATTQKPVRVLDASRRYYERYNSNVHRGAHHLCQLATDAHEGARLTAARFLGAQGPEEVLFTSGCTMGINMAAAILGRGGMVAEGDEIVISTSEHHANIVPWQMLCEETGAKLRVIPLTEDCAWNMETYEALLSGRTKVVALGHVSNALGLINPVEEAVRLAKANNPETVVLIDGAQAVSHMKVDVRELGCDFYAFSGHKLYAPTGIGALWGRKDLLELLPPWMGGGEMISEVTFEKTTYNKLPFKYEAGTPNIEGAIAMGEAMDFVSELGLGHIAAHEEELTRLAVAGLRELPGVRVFGGDARRGSAVSFVIDGIHHYDVGTLLDQRGVAVRTGHHCCQPLMASLGISGTTRVSFACYNTEEEVNIFLEALQKAIEMLS